MLASIQGLQQQLEQVGANLACFYDAPEAVIKKLHATVKVDAVFMNRDYSPFSRTRDHHIHHCCQDLNISLYYLPDALITEPEQMLKSDGAPYKVFTPFYNKARLLPVSQPKALEQGCFYSGNIKIKLYDFNALIDQKSNSDIAKGGQDEAIKILQQLERHSEYQQQRDIPSLSATTGLSAHLKFGACSIREAYYSIQIALGSEHPLIKQLYWRDFFTHIGFHFPHVFGHAFHSKYDAIAWSNNRTWFQAWAEGRTGFPIVDAGMRQLNQSGFMHNRVRMITASFLVKDLQIDWRWGERYFAQHLTDYDPCINNGNWQWAASTGCDAQPYFRIFNPWLQQQKFDPTCDYIYQWIAELREVPVAVIQQWDKKQLAGDYPVPIIDHSIQSQRTKELFKSC